MQNKGRSVSLVCLFMTSPALLTNFQMSAWHNETCPPWGGMEGPHRQTLTQGLTLQPVKKMNVWVWRTKSSFPFPVSQEGGGRGILGSLVRHHFSFLLALPPLAWACTADCSVMLSMGPLHSDKHLTVHVTTRVAAVCTSVSITNSPGPVLWTLARKQDGEHGTAAGSDLHRCWLQVRHSGLFLWVKQLHVEYSGRDESVDICYHPGNVLLANFTSCDNNMLTDACKMMTMLKYKVLLQQFSEHPIMESA